MLPYKKQFVFAEGNSAHVLSHALFQGVCFTGACPAWQIWASETMGTKQPG